MKSILQSQALLRAAFGVYLALTLVLLFTPVASSLPSSYFTGLDKVVHFVLFGGLTGLGCRVLPSARAAVLFAVALAGATELLQAFIPYRSTELLDFVGGAAGAVVGAYLTVTLTAVVRRRGTREE